MHNKIINFFCLLFLISATVFAKGIQSDSLKIGAEIQNFTLLNTVKGQPEKVSLSDYAKSKGVILVFMTNGCYHCILYRERIKELHQLYAQQGYPVITINPSNPSYALEETLDEMKKNAIKEKYQFPYLQDSIQELTLKLGVRYTPEVFVFSNENKNWVLKYKGAIDNDMENKNPEKINYVQNEINALLSEKRAKTHHKTK